MGRINRGRVLLGGLVAGVIFIVVDFFLNGVVLAADWESALKALGLTPSPNALVFFVIWALLAGIGAIWLYAAVRPRFGPGPKTAVLAGLAFWIFGGAADSRQTGLRPVPTAAASDRRAGRIGGRHCGVTGRGMDL